MTLALLMEGCASAAVESLCDRAQQALVEESGLYGTDRFSPGYGDFPLAFQPVLLSLLDAPRRMGLHVTAEAPAAAAQIGHRPDRPVHLPAAHAPPGCGQCPACPPPVCIERKVLSVIHPAELQFLDGAMGTMLQHSGADYGECPESLCLTAPQVIRDIHTAYLEAGSRILYSCTFGSNRYKLAGTPYSTRQLIPAAVALARQAAAPYGAQVALDIGPIGQLLEPNGTLAFEEAYDIFQEQIFLGSQAGADLIVIETMTDLYEVKGGGAGRPGNVRSARFCHHDV